MHIFVLFLWLFWISENTGRDAADEVRQISKP